MEEISISTRYKSGVYQIVHKSSGRTYIGATVNIYNRFHNHVCKLNKQQHNNYRLQEEYNRDGFSAFRMEVLELCDTSLLNQREQYWVDKLKPAYNIRTQVESNVGIKVKEEKKRKISEELKRRFALGEITTYKQEHLKIPLSVWTIDGKFVGDYDCCAEASRQLGHSPNGFRCVMSGMARRVGPYIALKQGSTFDRIPLEYTKLPSAGSNAIRHESGRCFVSAQDCSRIMNIPIKRVRKTSTLL